MLLQNTSDLLKLWIVNGAYAGSKCRGRPGQNHSRDGSGSELALTMARQPNESPQELDLVAIRLVVRS